MRKGKQSVAFEEPPVITGYSSVAGRMEGEGPLGKFFDEVESDPMCGGSSWEEAESTLQAKALEIAVRKARLMKEQLHYLIGGDLLGQLIATSYAMETFSIPYFGIYGACSTLGEGLSLAAMLVAAGYGEHVAAITSSHNGSAEKQFRFPTAYGNQKPLAATWTVTGSGAFIISSNSHKEDGLFPKITGCTTGKIMDYGVKDSMHMGAVMAPAAANVIENHLEDFSRNPKDFDQIITGDLGKIGQEILYDILKARGYDIKDRHMDCGVKVFACDEQDTHSGGSGCGCCAITLASYVLPKIRKREWKRVLFVPTGALLSPVSYNEGNSVPSIAHGVVIEA